MVTCHYCSQPVCGSGMLNDRKTIVPLCERHAFEHKEYREAQEKETELWRVYEGAAKASSDAYSVYYTRKCNADNIAKAYEDAKQERMSKRLRRS